VRRRKKCVWLAGKSLEYKPAQRVTAVNGFAKMPIDQALWKLWDNLLIKPGMSGVQNAARYGRNCLAVCDSCARSAPCSGVNNEENSMAVAGMPDQCRDGGVQRSH